MKLFAGLTCCAGTGSSLQHPRVSRKFQHQYCNEPFVPCVSCFGNLIATYRPKSSLWRKRAVRLTVDIGLFSWGCVASPQSCVVLSYLPPASLGIIVELGRWLMHQSRPMRGLSFAMSCRDNRLVAHAELVETEVASRC
jgi:hypothetical protein